MLRALYEWILENDCTPYVLVNAMADNVEVPQQFVKNGQIVLNVSPVAVTELNLSNDSMQFNGRFGGIPLDVFVPMSAIMGIYSRENGQGMMFDPEDDPNPEPPKKNGPKEVAKKSLGLADGSSRPNKNKPGLKVVK